MSIKTKNGVKFSFIDDNGLEQVAPQDSDIYVHVTDNGNGAHEIHCKVRRIIMNGETAQKQEIGWHRVKDEDGMITTLPSNTPNLLTEASILALASIREVNLGVEFTISN